MTARDRLAHVKVTARKCRLARVIVTADPTPIELLSAIMAFGWGILLALPANTFATSPTYNAMSSLAPERVWAIAMLAIGLLQAAATLHGKVKARKPLAFFATLTWAFIAVMMISANAVSTAGVAYGVVTLLSLWSYLRMDVFNHL